MSTAEMPDRTRKPERRYRQTLNIRELRHLALRLNLPLEVLERAATYAESNYSAPRFVPKKTGGTRTIEPPLRLLKRIQRCINRQLLAGLWLPDSIHAYRKHRSPKSAARPHARNPFLWVADVRDFYPSISSRRVNAVFWELGCTQPVSNLLTRLTTRRYCLPQGAPTSPMIANLYLRTSGLAARLDGLARKQALIVTFFGDDILISGRGSFKGLQPHLEGIINSSGLKLHPTKTKPVAGPGDRRVALGILFSSDGLDVPKSYRRKLRTLIAMCKRYGPGALATAGVTNKDPKAFLSGKIAAAEYVNPKNACFREDFHRIDWLQRRPTQVRR